MASLADLIRSQSAAAQRQGMSHQDSYSQMDPGMERYLAGQESATRGVPLEAPMIAPDDLIGSGLLKGVLSGAALMGGIKSVGKKQAREVYTANKEIFDNAHKADNLSFQALPIQETSEAVSIYRSPRYGGKAPSEYMVGMVNGEPAYIRKSDHWGKFTTNIKEGTAEAKAAGLGDEIGDQFGRVGYKPHNWELQGGISSQHADRIATAQALRDVLPEAQRFSFIGDRLWDEIYALSKPGKREAGYIPLSRLLESKK